MLKNLLNEQFITVTGNSGAKINIRFSDLVEWTNEGIYCVNSEGVVVYANERFCKSLGYKTTEIINKDVFELMHGEQNIVLSKSKFELRKRGVSDSYSIQMQKKNGEPLWLRISGKPIIDARGEFMGSIVISTEIERQRRLEEELMYAKEELETKVLARTRQLSEANQMLNDEIKERRLAEISLKRAEALLQKLNLELEEKVKERTKELQEMNAKMLVEIAGKEKIQHELKMSEQLYREIARNLPKAAVFIFDKKMKYILAEGPLVGIISRPKSEIEGRSIFESIRESDRIRVEGIYRKILRGESEELEQSFLERSLKVYHLPIRNDDGEIIYGMVMIFDISDLNGAQRELEQRASQLERSNEELERFAYVASHDLQSPLRTIASYLQLLELRYKDKLGSEANEFIDFSVQGAKRMQQIILDLLNYSKLSSVKDPFTNTNTGEVIKSVLKNLDSVIKATGAEIIVSDMHTVVAEPNHLYQLFRNLIDNSLKFVKNGKPVIKIFSIENTDNWEFMIADNGIGIKEEYQERIFRIFQRLHTVTEYPGTGVGLAICQKVVQLHGGKIWYVSNPGEGTTFHFTISKNLK